MPNTIKVRITSSDNLLPPPTHCAVIITNCDAMHVDTKRQQTNGRVPAYFQDVPLGRYYIVVLPEGSNARHMQFIKVDGAPRVTSVTFDISAIDPTGRITAIVLVGDLPSRGKTVTIQGRTNGYKQVLMTNDEGVAEFRCVPDSEIYDIIAEHESEIQTDSCTLEKDTYYERRFRFNACSGCGR